MDNLINDATENQRESPDTEKEVLGTLKEDEAVKKADAEEESLFVNESGDLSTEEKDDKEGKQDESRPEGSLFVDSDDETSVDNILHVAEIDREVHSIDEQTIPDSIMEDRHMNNIPTEIIPTQTQMQIIEETNQDKDSTTTIITTPTAAESMTETQTQVEVEEGEKTTLQETYIGSKKRAHDLIVNPKTITTRSHKKKITGKLIDRFWQPLSHDSFQSMQGIISMCINQSIQRYRLPSKSRKSVELSKKMIQAQDILSESWSTANETSFGSRLRETLLPPGSDSDSDIFNLDKLLRRRKYLETYLLAELKQLNELEKNYKSYEIIYKLDLKYLEELRKSTGKENSLMRKEINEKRENMSIDVLNSSKVKIHQTTKNKSTFNPNDDLDTIEVLSKLTRHLESINKNVNQLKDLNTGLEEFYHHLNI